MGQAVAPNDPTAATDGSASIQQGLRLGWQVAEVRGRLRLGDDPRLAPTTTEVRTDHALPLAVERTSAEQRIESQRVLEHLSQELQLDVDVALLIRDSVSPRTTPTAYLTG